MLDVAMWAIESMRGFENCLPKRISNTSGIYWLNDAKEVPDTQVVTYDFGDFMLVWELQSFQNNRPFEGMDGGTGFYGTEGTLIVDDEGWRVHRKGGAGVFSHSPECCRFDSAGPPAVNDIQGQSAARL